MSNSTSKANWFWIALLLGLGVGGVYLLARTLGQSISGWILIGGALLLLWGTEMGSGPPALWVRAFERFAPTSNELQIPLAVLAIGMAVASTLLSIQLEKQPNESLRTVCVLLWAGGGLALVFAHLHVSLEDLRTWWQTYRREVLVVTLITLFAALLRFYKLGAIPNVIDGDEGWTGLAALKLLPAASFIYDNPFSFFEGFGRVQLRLIRAIILLLGQTSFSLRLVPAIGGTLAVPALYLFVRYVLGPRSAWVAALLLAVSHSHVHFSRTAAVAYIQSTWFAPLELYFFLSGLEKRDRTRMVIGGLLLGFHFNFYVSAQIVAALVLVFALIAWFVARPLIKENLANIGWFFGSALVLALPSLLWAFNHPNDFSARWGKEGTFQSGWLANEMVLTGKPALLILAERFIHACLAIFVLPFREFYWSPMPVLDFITATLFLVGVFLALRRTREPRFLFLNGWLWSGVFSLSVFAVPPGADSYRLLMVLPAMCVMAMLGWDYLHSLAGRLSFDRSTLQHPSTSLGTGAQGSQLGPEAGGSEQPAPALAPSATGGAAWVGWSLALVVVVAGLNLKTYYLDFARSCLYMNGEPISRGWSLIGDYLRDHRPIDQAYLLGDQAFQYGTHLSVDYLSGSVPMTNILEPFSSVEGHGNLVFVLIPTRANEFDAVWQFAEGGKVTRVFDCGHLSFIGYEVEKK